MMPGTVETLVSFRMDNRKADHRLVRVIAILPSFRMEKTFRRRVPEYCRTAVRHACDNNDPDIVAKVACMEHYLHQMPEIPVNVEPTSHHFLAASYIEEGLAAFQT